MKNPGLVFLAALAGIAALALSAAGPEPSADFRATVERLVRTARETNGAYDTIRGLTDSVGPRLSGSPGDARAVAWAEAALKRLGFANVRAETVTVPRWERGEESGEIVSPAPFRLSLCALGGSVGTPAGGIEAEVVEARSLEGVDALGEKAKGRIVFVWKVMERRSDGSGYGATVPIRGGAASRAAKVGAIGVLIRSVGTSNARFPHTGAMSYQEGVAKIPAAEPYLASVAAILKPFGLGDMKKGGGGADLGPLRAAGVPLFSPIQDSSRYFDLHHSADDTFDKIDREELNTGVAAVAALAYSLAESEAPLERIPEAERASRRER